MVGLSKHYGKCPSSISVPEIKTYFEYLADQGKSWSTINIVHAACNLLYGETLNQIERVQSIKRPKLPKRIPVVFTEEDVEYLLSHVKNIKHNFIDHLISWPAEQVG